MEQPKSLEEGRERYIQRLLQTLYETMQGAYDWARNLDCTYKGHRYYKSYTHPQIQSWVIDDELTLTSTWTDNILDISSTKKKEILAKSELSTSYEIIDIREAKLILGMHINRNKETGNIILSQYAYNW